MSHVVCHLMTLHQERSTILSRPFLQNFPSSHVSIQRPLMACPRQHSELSIHIIRRVFSGAEYCTTSLLHCVGPWALGIPWKLSSSNIMLITSRMQDLARVKDHLIGQDIDGTMSGISGGERRRVSVGISLVTDAQAIFLDEPTTGLDSESAETLMQLLARLAQKRGKTVSRLSCLHPRRCARNEEQSQG